jgi:multidrug efflux pump subunit AcrA (membrane-fusion protein)
MLKVSNRAKYSRCYPNLGVSALVLGAAFMTSSCTRSDSVSTTAVMPEAVTVGTATVEIRPMAEHLTVSSELVPFQEIDVYAKEAGYVKTLSVDYGDHVHKDQVMAVLEIPELEALLQEDQATIKARTDEVTRAEHEVSHARQQELCRS